MSVRFDGDRATDAACGHSFLLSICMPWLRFSFSRDEVRSANKKERDRVVSLFEPTEISVLFA